MRLLPLPQYPGDLITNLTLSLLSSIDYSQLLVSPECQAWAPLNHIYYQLAHTALLLASLAPPGSGSFLCVRALLVVSFSFSLVWGLTMCWLDTTAWSSLLAAINLCWCVRDLWRRRTVSLSKEMETVYMKMFKPLKVSRGQFQVGNLTLFSCAA